jgi:hypothetical protein
MLPLWTKKLVTLLQPGLSFAELEAQMNANRDLVHQIFSGETVFCTNFSQPGDMGAFEFEPAIGLQPIGVSGMATRDTPTATLIAAASRATPPPAKAPARISRGGGLLAERGGSLSRASNKFPGEPAEDLRAGHSEFDFRLRVRPNPL